MRIAQIEFDGAPAVAISQSGSDWYLLETSNMPHVNRVRLLIEQGFSDLNQLVLGRKLNPSSSFLCPIEGVQKIICVGKNYADHATEMGSAVPELPVIFNKLPSALIGHRQSIVLPEISEQVDYEAELVVVIGQAGSNIARENAMQHVFGYTIGNDVTARDWQKGRPGGQWLLGKTFDTFAPLGPYIVTADEITDPHDLSIQLRLNERLMQSGNTRDLIFPIDQLISHLSMFCTLRPGDLLFTGTPAGVGAGRDPQVFLTAGDQVEIEIAEIGKLVNSVVST